MIADNPYEPPANVDSSINATRIHVNVATSTKHPLWQLLGTVEGYSDEPFTRFTVSVVENPEPRLVEVLAVHVNKNGTIYCKIERHGVEPTFRHFGIDIIRDETEHWQVLLCSK